MKITWKAFTLLSIAFLGTSTVTAQTQSGAQSGARTGAKQRIIFDKDIVIQGKIVKPQVQFIISREKGTTDEALELKESFVPRIIESVQESPF